MRAAPHTALVVFTLSLVAAVDRLPTDTDTASLPSWFGECYEPLDRGRWCDFLSFMYYYDAQLETCHGFHYSGCGTSSNRYKTLEDCLDACDTLVHQLNAAEDVMLALEGVGDEEDEDLMDAVDMFNPDHID